jgi:hypothetical protein
VRLQCVNGLEEGRLPRAHFLEQGLCRSSAFATQTQADGLVHDGVIRWHGILHGLEQGAALLVTQVGIELTQDAVGAGAHLVNALFLGLLFGRIAEQGDVAHAARHDIDLVLALGQQADLGHVRGHQRGCAARRIAQVNAGRQREAQHGQDADDKGQSEPVPDLPVGEDTHDFLAVAATARHRGMRWPLNIDRMALR